MGMVHAYKKGELDTKGMDPSLLAKVKEVAGSMKDSDAKKFAETKHKGLPEEVKEGAEHSKCPKCREKALVKGKPKKGSELPQLKCSKCGYVVRTKKLGHLEMYADRLDEQRMPTFKEFLLNEARLGSTHSQRGQITRRRGAQSKGAQMKQRPQGDMRQTFGRIYQQLKNDPKMGGKVSYESWLNRVADTMKLSPKGVQQLQQTAAFREFLQLVDFYDKQQGSSNRGRGSEADANRALAGTRRFSDKQLEIMRRLGA